MTYSELLQRITVSPEILAGKPVVRGTRLSVDFLLNLPAHGSTRAEGPAGSSPGREAGDQ